LCFESEVLRRLLSSEEQQSNPKRMEALEHFRLSGGWATWAGRGVGTGPARTKPDGLSQTEGFARSCGMDASCAPAAYSDAAVCALDEAVATQVFVRVARVADRARLACVCKAFRRAWGAHRDELLATTETVQGLAHAETPRALAWVPQGDAVLVAARTRGGWAADAISASPPMGACVLTYRWPGGRMVRRTELPGAEDLAGDTLAFSPSAHRLAGAGALGHCIRLWDPVHGTLLKTLHPLSGHFRVLCLTWGPGLGPLAAVNGVDGIVVVHPNAGVATRGELSAPAALIHSAGCSARRGSLAFRNPDGDLLATVSREGPAPAVHVWGGTDEGIYAHLTVLQGGERGVECIAWTPDGGALVGKHIGSGTFTTWVAGSQGASTLSVGRVCIDGPCYGLFFSPNGSHLAALSKPATWADRGRVDFFATLSRVEEGRKEEEGLMVSSRGVVDPAVRGRELDFPVRRWDMIVAEVAWSADSSLVAVLAPLHPGALLHLLPVNKLGH